MQSQTPQQVLEETFLDMASKVSLWGAAGLTLLLLVAVLVLLVLRRRKVAPKDEPSPLKIDLASLGAHDPPKGTLILECHGVPVRLAALILAPVGRTASLPPPEKLPELVERIVPGLSEVVVRDKPRVCRWPPQLSPRGFVHLVFANAQLPGDRGRGTPWCTVAGKFQLASVQFLAALVLRSAEPTPWGEIIIEEPGHWGEALRVRKEGVA
jgi:hypothetical protein